MSRETAKHYQNNKKRFKKSLVKGIRIFLKKKKTKKTKRENKVMKDIRISQKMKNKS